MWYFIRSLLITTCIAVLLGGCTVLAVTWFATPARAGTLSDNGLTTCVQFLADSKEGGAASESHRVWVTERVTSAGLAAFKVDVDAHMSLLVHCVLFKTDTLGDATKQLIKELGAK